MNIFTYSPKRNKPNFIAEYSVWKPPTNSVSHSGKSKGALLVSANAATKKMINANGWKKIFQWIGVFLGNG